MLASFTPEEFCELWAANYLDPIADEWRQTGEICATILNAALLANSSKPLRPDQLATWDQFVPQLECLAEHKPQRDNTAPLSSTIARQRFGR